MCEFSVCVAFNKTTNRYKTWNGEKRRGMSLLEIADEKLHPSQRSSLKINTYWGCTTHMSPLLIIQPGVITTCIKPVRLFSLKVYAEANHMWHKRNIPGNICVCVENKIFIALSLITFTDSEEYSMLFQIRINFNLLVQFRLLILSAGYGPN